MAVTQTYDKTRNKLLRDPQTAAEYLNAVLEENNPDALLKALRNIAEAQTGGMKSTAESAQLNRESLYKMLSEDGNPRLSSLEALLHTFGLRLAVAVDKEHDQQNCA